MKKFIFVLAAASFLTACTNEPKTETPVAEAPAPATEKVATNPVVPLPYVPTYSNSFEFGKGEYAAMILQGSWKDWDENKLDNMKNWVADTITAIHSDMLMVKGVDNLMAKWKKDRANYKSVNNTIDVVMPIYAKDKNEHWVLVWASSTSVDLKGKADTMNIMEAWRINKDGKADYLNQYDRAKRKK
jgi:PBP1b-binding outer membrane lipoprotein LpoB